MADYLPDVIRDYGPVTEAVRDVDMAHAAEALMERAFELTAVERAREGLISAHLFIEKTPLTQALIELNRATEGRWHDRLGMPPASEIIHSVFSEAVGSKHETSEIQTAAKNSLTALHPDRGLTAGGVIAAVLHDLSRKKRRGMTFVASSGGREAGTEVVTLDEGMVEQFEMPKALALVLHELAKEVNDPNASQEVLAQGYKWLDLTAYVPAQLTSVTEKLTIRQRKEPVELLVATLQATNLAMGMLIVDRGGFRVYSSADESVGRYLEGCLYTEIPGALEEIAERLDSPTIAEDLEGWEFPLHVQEAMIMQTERLLGLVKRYDVIRGLYHARAEAAELLAHIHIVRDRLRDAQDRQLSFEINTIVHGALRRALQSKL